MLEIAKRYTPEAASSPFRGSAGDLVDACIVGIYERYYCARGKGNIRVSSISVDRFQSRMSKGLAPDGDVVLVHGLVRERRRLMAVKSCDALHLYELYGSDVFTISFVLGSGMRRDIYLNEEKCKAALSFCSKLWNAARFFALSYEPGLSMGRAEEEDQWIIHELEMLRDEFCGNMDAFMPGLALAKLHNFVRKRLCGWYIEQIKPRIYGIDAESKAAAQHTLYHVLTQLLEMLHPFAPFVCRHIRSMLGGSENSTGENTMNGTEKNSLFKNLSPAKI